MNNSAFSKNGLHGTLYRYAIQYRDTHDPACPTMTWCCWGYSAAHAEEQFYDTDDEGWTIVSVGRVRA